MNLRKNKKGIYEYVLTKSVMLIFIMGLVGIFMTFHETITINSAQDIADSESARLAKQIDDALGFKGVSNTMTVHLKRELEVGRDLVPYNFKITETGLLTIEFEQYPYIGITGMGKFGNRLAALPGHSPSISCEWADLRNGVSITVIKEASYEFDTTDNELYYVVDLTLDASDDCDSFMRFQQRFKE